MHQSRYKTFRSFCQKQNLVEPTYSAHESGKRGLTVKKAEFYSTILNISYRWLVTGHGDMHKLEQSENRLTEVMKEAKLLEDQANQIKRIDLNIYF